MSQSLRFEIQTVQTIRGRGLMVYGLMHAGEAQVGDEIELRGSDGHLYQGTVRSVESFLTPGISRPYPHRVGLGINGSAAEHLAIGLSITSRS